MYSCVLLTIENLADVLVDVLEVAGLHRSTVSPTQFSPVLLLCVSLQPFAVVVLSILSAYLVRGVSPLWYGFFQLFCARNLHYKVIFLVMGPSLLFNWMLRQGPRKLKAIVVKVFNCFMWSIMHINCCKSRGFQFRWCSKWPMPSLNTMHKRFSSFLQTVSTYLCEYL